MQIIRTIRSWAVYVLCVTTACTAGARPIPLDRQDIQYVYDADTFFVACPECKKGKQSVRVMGVDSAELKGRCEEEKQLARKAKQFTVAKLRNAKTIELIPNPKRRYDRYKRLLAFVRIDGKDLGELLVDAGLGRPYFRGRRKGWCSPK